MRAFFTLIAVLVTTASIGQQSDAQKAAIDAEVQRISEQTKLTEKHFSIVALKKVGHRISYRYLQDQSGHIRISRQFRHKKDTIQQIFYLKKGELILAREIIIAYYTENNKTDSITWAGDFYFSKGKLIDHITLGHGKSEMDNWNPEQGLLTALNESKRDILRYKKSQSQ
jgi:hypothetical protein